jgi:thioredoxin 1
MSIPTLLYFKDGQLVDKTIGALPKAAIENRLERIQA